MNYQTFRIDDEKGRRPVKGNEINLSLIIVSRNRSEKLKRCLASISDQEIKEAKGELIVVNNGSVDNTNEIIDQFKKTTTFPLIIINQQIIGNCYAKNAGIQKARGKLLLFIDDDCYLEKDYLIKAQAIFEGNKIDYCFGQVWLYDKTDLDYTTDYFKSKQIIGPFTYIMPGMILGANMIFHQRVINKIGLFDVNFGPGSPLFSCEDVEYAARASWAGFVGAKIPELVVYHHHGRKLNKEIATLQKYYAYGRGGFYIKYILKGKIKYLLKWFEKIRYNRLIFIYEIQGSIRYLFINTMLILRRLVFCKYFNIPNPFKETRKKI